MLKAYKIRDKRTKKFSKGGTNTSFLWTNRGGKTWSNIGALKNHLNQFLYHDGTLRKDYPYHNAEIVEVEIDYDDCFSYGVDVLVDEIKDNKKEQAKKSEELHRKWVEEQERKKLAELKAKYEGR